MENKPAAEDTIRFIIDGPLEDYIKSQTVFMNGYCTVYVGGWRFERNEDDPPHIYREARPEMMAQVKMHFRKELADAFENMKGVWFINYNNGYEKTYTKYDIDKDMWDINWREFINKIPTTRITGCTPGHFEQALQLHNIAFLHGVSLNQKGWEKWQEVEWNRINIKVLEHDNIGNY